MADPIRKQQEGHMTKAESLHMDKLLSLIEPIPFSGCWVYMGATNGTSKYGRGGYGVISIGASKNKYAHRVVYECTYGSIPKGMMVCHKCDVRCCVNPLHLFLGTAKDNHLDKVMKGRNKSPGAPGEKNATRKYPWIVQGENNGRAALNWEIVRAIRKAHSEGKKQRQLAYQYGIGQSQISRICRNEHWKENA
jgi:hypothetical protein